MGRFCDAVVALDDGSTDDTAEILARSPLVATLLRNPRRTGYGGWNDAVNRNRLLRAAALLRPEWILSLDADERIDAGDGAALRRFLPTDALPGLAHGLPCHAMAEAGGVGDELRYVDQPLLVWRLFAFQPGQRFPDDRLPFAPVPVGTPRNAHLRTTIRIQYLAMVSDEHRRARFEKYRQADPDCRFWPDYSPIHRAPAESDLRLWLNRLENLPVVAGAATSAFLHAETAESRGGSVGSEFAFALIVLAGSNPIPARRSIQSALAQRIDGRLEVVVVAPDGADMGLEGRNVPQHVSLRDATHVGTPGSARKAGLAASSAPFVAFLPGEFNLADGSVAAMLLAHQEGYASVGGSVSPEFRSASNRAMQWIAYGARRPAARGMISTTPRWCSYSRAMLMELGGFPEKDAAGEEIAVNRRLARRAMPTLGDRAVRLALASRPASRRDLVRLGYGRGVAEARFFLGAYADHDRVLTKRFVVRRLVAQVPRRLHGVLRLPRGDRGGATDGGGALDRRNGQLARPRHGTAPPGSWQGATAPWPSLADASHRDLLGCGRPALRDRPKSSARRLAARDPVRSRHHDGGRGEPVRTAVTAPGSGLPSFPTASPQSWPWRPR